MPAMTRKTFLKAASGGTVMLLLQACGGGGGGDGGGSTPTATPSTGTGSCSSTGGAISGNHGHSLSIPRADLDSTVSRSYSILGTAGHDHTITLSATQLSQLKAGTAVTVTSTTDSAHDHSVSVTCA